MTPANELMWLEQWKTVLMTLNNGRALGLEGTMFPIDFYERPDALLMDLPSNIELYRIATTWGDLGESTSFKRILSWLDWPLNNKVFLKIF